MRRRWTYFFIGKECLNGIDAVLFGSDLDDTYKMVYIYFCWKWMFGWNRGSFYLEHYSLSYGDGLERGIITVLMGGDTYSRS